MEGKVLSGQSGSRGIRCCNPEIGTAAPIARIRNTQDTAEPSNSQTSQTSNRGTQTYHPLGVRWIFVLDREKEGGREINKLK